jgi:hypothetical protein
VTDPVLADIRHWFAAAMNVARDNLSPHSASALIGSIVLAPTAAVLALGTGVWAYHCRTAYGQSARVLVKTVGVSPSLLFVGGFIAAAVARH